MKKIPLLAAALAPLLSLSGFAADPQSEAARAPSHLRPSNLQSFMWGVAYYPDHGEIATLDQDAERMRAAGMNTVRMAEFAWDLMEPEEGRFDFTLFDETVARLGAKGIKSILCTPTAAPPRWLTVKHPEILRVDSQGVVMSHGSRQHASTCNDLFREYSRRITRAMAEHYKDNPNVIGWQTDNEFHCHFSQDYSSGALKQWAEFLKEKFGNDISALNRAWGTAFWAQSYTNFEDVPFPAPKRPTHLNPAHQLDYFRFLSWSVTRFQHDQVEILRAAQPKWWITHNGLFDYIDYRGQFGQDLDVLGYDVYPNFTYDDTLRASHQAWALDAARAWTGNFWIPEHQSGPGGQTDYLHDTPEPGELRRMLYASLAHGADSVLLFRWRSARFGAEEYWCGVLDHDNVPRRRYDEVAKTGAEFKRVGPALLGTHVVVDVGIAATDFNNTHAHETLNFKTPSPDLVAEDLHRNFWSAGYSVGVVHPGDVLDGLKLYVIPHFTLVDPKMVPKLEAWVREGGVLVLGARSGTKDLDNNVVTELLPGALRPLVGATVVEYGRQNIPDARPLNLEIGGNKVQSREWYEQLDPDAGAEVWSRWTTRHLAGTPSATLHRVGKGAVLYVGTYLKGDVGKALVPELVKLAQLAPALPGIPQGVEVVRRQSGEKTLWFLMNQTDDVKTVKVPAGRDLVSDKDTSGDLELPGRGVAVIQCGAP